MPSCPHLPLAGHQDVTHDPWAGCEHELVDQRLVRHPRKARQAGIELDDIGVRAGLNAAVRSAKRPRAAG